MPVPLFSASDAGVWDGTTATAYTGGTGTEADPYLISDGQELAYLAHMVNTSTDYEDTYFRLISNIVLNDTAGWESWGTQAPANIWPVIGVDEQNEAGSSITVTALCDDTAYRFIGWYANSNFTRVLSNRKTYRFTVTEAMAEAGTYALTALYVPVSMSTVTVSGGGSIFTVNGNEYSSQYVAEHRPGSIVTIGVQNTENFAYWTNALGKILSYEPSFELSVSGNISLTAVYKTKLENKYTVIFVSDYGQVMHRQQLTAAEAAALQMPAVPLKTGYEPGHWAMDHAQILQAIENGQDVITVRPIYPEIIRNAAVTLVGGTLADGTTGGNFPLNTQLTVTADAPAEGMVFACWQDAEGNIVSYEASYSFLLSGDTALTAVYAAETVEKLGTAQITAIHKQESVNGISFVASFSVPEGCTIDFAGIVATSDAAKAANRTAENADYVRGNGQSQTSGRFTWTKSNTGDTTQWYVRAYLVYTDAEGITHTVYSSVASACYTEI